MKKLKLFIASLLFLAIPCVLYYRFHELRELTVYRPHVSGVAIVEAFTALTFERPVDLQSARDSSNILYVVEQAGIIKSFVNDKNTSSVQVFLDIRDKVAFDQNEQGLLGLAFDPDFKNNGYFYVNYVAENPKRTVIERYRLGKDGRVDLNVTLKILEVDQPYSNHNGGQTSFGPDGYLYIAFGDGGSGGDPHGNGQSLFTLLGKIIRIDVKDSSEAYPYSIPPDNPFIQKKNARPEIYAYGLRNPWRFSWDNQNRLWAADVGQNAYEEVDIIEKGKNYGWNIMEANACYLPETGCEEKGLGKPIFYYGRAEGQSVTGGFYYSLNTVPAIKNSYICADFVKGRFWSIRQKGLGFESSVIYDSPLINPASFGVDDQGELYICAFDGKIYKFSNPQLDEESAQGRKNQ